MIRANDMKFSTVFYYHISFILTRNKNACEMLTFLWVFYYLFSPCHNPHTPTSTFKQLFKELKEYFQSQKNKEQYMPLPQSS